MKRFLLIAAGATSLSIVLVLVAALGFRSALAEWALKRALDQQGYKTELTVSAFTGNQVIITGIRSDAASVESLTVDYRLSDLLSGRLEGIDVQGLRANLDLSAPSGASSGLPDLPPLPPIRLRDARVALTTPQGPVTARIEGRIVNPEAKLLSAHLMLDLESDFGRFSGPLDAVLKDLEPSFLELNLDGQALLWEGRDLGPSTLLVRLSEDRLTGGLHLQAPANQGRLDATLGSFRAREDLMLEGALSLQPESPLWSLLPAEGLQAEGSLTLDVFLPRPLDAAARLSGAGLSPATLLSALIALGVESDISLDFRELTAKNSPRPLDAAIRLKQDAKGASLEGTLGGPSDPTHLDLRADLESAGALLLGNLSFEGALAGDDAIFRAILPSTPEGSLTFSGELSATQPPGMPEGFDALLAAAPSGKLSLAGEKLAWKDILSGGELTTEVEIETEGGELVLTLAGDSRLNGKPGPGVTLPDFLISDDAITVRPTGDALALAVRDVGGSLRIESGGGVEATQGDRRLEQQGAIIIDLEPEGPTLTGRALSLTASSLPLPQATLTDGSYRGALDYTAGELALDGELSATLALQGVGGLEAQSLSLGGPLEFRHDPRARALTFREGLTLSFSEGLRVKDFTIRPSEVLRIERLSARHAETLEALTLEASLPALAITGPARLDVQPGGRLSLSLEDKVLTGEALLPSLGLPDRAASLEGLALSANLSAETLPELRPSGDGPAVTLSIAEILHPALSDAAMTVSATQAEATVALSGALTLARGKARLPLSGQLDPTSGSLSARLGGSTLLFEQGGLQPADLSPLLAALEEASGEVTPSLNLRLSGGSLRASGELRADALGFTSAGTKVRALNGTVVFSDILAPRSDGLQEVTIARLDPAIPIRNVTARFSVEPGDNGQPLVLIERIEGATDFGPVLVTEGRITPLTQSGRMKISFPDLDLAQLTALLGVEGLSATGKLSGSLPIGLENGMVRIDQGSLDDQETGVIRYDSPTARQALVGGGQSVTLMLDALENFQYQDFGVTLDKPSEDELTISFSLEGKNPEVLDGYPFRFNINLSTDPRSLLEALRVGSDIGKLLLDRTGTFPRSDP